MIAKQTYFFESNEYSIERYISIELSGISGAQFSECGRYRYGLWRIWSAKSLNEMVMFIGLNPSTADATHNDATMRRCIAFAKRLGYGGLFMCNAYGWRSTSPKALADVDDPIGPENDYWLGYYRCLAGKHIAAWGSNCKRDRQVAVCKLFREPIFCFGTTANGSPKHPLYLKSTMAIKPYTGVRHVALAKRDLQPARRRPR
jgi:hypothetical protein